MGRPARTESRDRLESKTKQLTRSSRTLHLVDHYTSLPLATVVLLVVLAASVLVGAVLGFPGAWTTGFEVGSSVLTLAMVTIIQHTQSREQTATQRKLDELIRASPGAESGLMMLEEQSDEAIHDVEARQRRSQGLVSGETLR